MFKSPYVIGVIIARQGSKGLPGKNMARLAGHPLLEYTIAAAKKAGTLNRVVLSTDSPEMAQYARSKGVDVPFLRPKRLALDTTHTPPVIEHAVRYIEKEEGRNVDIVLTLQPTSPFRKGKDIDAAVSLLLKNPYLDSIISVKPVSFPPFWMFRAKKQVLVPFVQDKTDYSLKERQQLPLVYQPNGAIFATRRRLLRKKGILYSAFAGGATGFIVMDGPRSIDIDHPVDLLMANSILRKRPELRIEL